MPYHHKIPYVRCECGFRKDNTEYDVPRIAAGDYCPRCGSQFTEYNELNRQSVALAGDRDREPDTWSPPSRRKMAVQAAAYGVSLAVVYGVFRLTTAPLSDETITINGETAPLFDPSMGNVVFAVVAFAMFIVFTARHAPGFVKHRGWA